MSVRTIVLSAAGASEPSWVLTSGDTTVALTYFNEAKQDALGNIFVLGTTAVQTAGSNDVYLLKLNSSGVYQWRKTIGTTGIDGSDNIGLMPDDTGGVLYTSLYSQAGVATRVWFLSLDSTGALSLNKSLDYGSVSSSDGRSYRASTGEVVTAYSANGTALISYIPSALTSVTWSRQDATSSSYKNAAVIANNAIYWAYGSYTGTYWVLRIVKFNTSGTSLASVGYRVSGDTTSQFDCRGMHADASGNIYVLTSGRLLKLDANLTLLWQKTVPFTYMSIDDAGNIYGGAYGTVNSFTLYKYDSSQNPVWKRTFAVTGATNMSFPVPRVVGSNSILVSNYYTPAGGTYAIGLLAKLPADGSLTGTHGDVVYSSVATTALTAGDMISGGTGPVAAPSSSPVMTTRSEALVSRTIAVNNTQW